MGGCSFKSQPGTHAFPQVTEIVSISLVMATPVYSLYMYIHLEWLECVFMYMYMYMVYAGCWCPYAGFV